MTNNSDKFILAIDLGTSGAKAVLASIHGEIIDFSTEETKLHLFPGGGAEQDPDDWWRAVKNSTRKILEKGIVPAEKIVAVCCTTQWLGTVPVDREGRHLRQAIIWMDSRGAPHIREIVKGKIEIEGYAIQKLVTWLRLTGGAPSHPGKDSIAHILYIKHEQPEIYQSTYKFLEPKDYLNMRLTGKFATSNEAITLHWVTDNRNISKIEYSERLLKLATLDREKLPDLKSATDILGTIKPEVAAELGLNQDAKVIMGTPDIHAAIIGSGAVKDYEPHLYIGTSSWLTCHVPFKKTDLFHNMASLPSAVPGRYFIANEQETAGECMRFLKDQILFHDDEASLGAQPEEAFDIINKIAEKVPPGSDKVIFTPWLYGERTPVEDHSVRAGFFNMSLNTSRAHLIRAVFEGVAFNTKWLHGHVEKFVKRPLDNINFIGGGALSDLWCQIYADVLNRRIRQTKQPVEANARGAAWLASAALGYVQFDDI